MNERTQIDSLDQPAEGAECLQTQRPEAPPVPLMQTQPVAVPEQPKPEV